MNPSYSLYRTTPLSELTAKDLKYLSLAVQSAENSLYDSSKRLGALLQGKGTRFLCR